MSDCLIVGGGVIGLSLAYELAGENRRVRVIDAGQPGREASWAGAGILPPAPADSADPLEQLTALSNQLHEQWSARLRSEQGLDNGYRNCGALYLARDASEADELHAFAEEARRHDIAADRVTRAELGLLEPALEPAGTLAAAYLLPGESQIRNPRHLKALLMGCAARGVEIVPGAAAEDFDVRSGRVANVRTSRGPMSADQICIASGCWSGALAKKLGVTLAIKPVRGQMLLFSLVRPLLGRIVNEGRRYLVPRADGRLLVGSTEEDAGFDRGTTARAMADLLEFALSLVPELGEAPLERSWAGLRPATADGRPYLGRVPGLENVVVAAGHFRSGLQLSTGTARVVSQLMCGRAAEVDLTAFRLDRNQMPNDAVASIKRARYELPLT